MAHKVIKAVLFSSVVFLGYMLVMIATYFRGNDMLGTTIAVTAWVIYAVLVLLCWKVLYRSKSAKAMAWNLPAHAAVVPLIFCGGTGIFLVLDWYNEYLIWTSVLFAIAAVVLARKNRVYFALAIAALGLFVFIGFRDYIFAA